MMVQGNNRINFAIVACVNWWPQKGKHSKRIYLLKSVLIWWTFNETKPCNFIRWLFRGCAWQIWQAVSNISDTKSLHCLTHWPLGDVAGSNFHYGDVIMDAIASQNHQSHDCNSTVYSDADQRKYQSSASLTFVRGIHRAPANSPHIWPITRKMFPFDDIIM